MCQHNLDWSLDDQGFLCFNNNCIEDEPDNEEDSKRMLKVSGDKKYAVVYNIAHFYADFYLYDDVDDEPKYLYSKKRNSYRNKKFFIEFFKDPTDPTQTLLVFNSQHGGLTIYYADTGDEKFSSEGDKFITSVRVINEKYLYMTCWYWQPIYCTYLYRIKDLLTQHDYNGIMIDSDFDIPNKPMNFKLNDEKMIEVFAKDDKWRRVYSLDDFYENHKAYKDYINNVHTTEQIKRNKNNLLFKIFNGFDYENVEYEDNAKEKLDIILNSADDDLIESNCFGNNSKSDLSYHVNSIVKENTFDDEKFNLLIPKTLFHGFTTNLRGLKEINLTFTFKKGDINLTMKVQQTMKLIKSDPNNFEIDSSIPCKITFS